jgi:hypothetical protein
MSDDTRSGNLAASLRRAAVDLSEVEAGLADLSTDDKVERVANILDRIAEDATDGATILRVLVASRERARGPLPQGGPYDAASPASDSGTS